MACGIGPRTQGNTQAAMAGCGLRPDAPVGCQGARSHLGPTATYCQTPQCHLVIRGCARAACLVKCIALRAKPKPSGEIRAHSTQAQRRPRGPGSRAIARPARALCQPRPGPRFPEGAYHRPAALCSAATTGGAAGCRCWGGLPAAMAGACASPYELRVCSYSPTAAMTLMQ